MGFCLVRPCLLPPCAEEYKRLRTMMVGASGKGAKGMMGGLGKQMGKTSGGMNPHNRQMNVAQMSRMLPPEVREPAGLTGLSAAWAGNAGRRHVLGQAVRLAVACALCYRTSGSTTMGFKPGLASHSTDHTAALVPRCSNRWAAPARCRA